MGAEEVKDMHRVQIRIPRHQFDELKSLADFEGRTVTDMVRQLVAIHLRDTKAVAAYNDNGGSK